MPSHDVSIGVHPLTVAKPRRRTNLTAIGLGILAAALTAQVATADYHGTGQMDTRVAVQDFAFAPAIVSITVGTSVVWEVRKDPEQHTVTPVEPGSFAASGQLSAGDDYPVQFSDPGRYDYVCSLHPFMTGTVIVEAVAVATQTAATVTVAPSASLSAEALSTAVVPSPIASPSLAEPIDGGSDGTTQVVILALILLIGVAGAGGLLWRRSTRHGGGSGGPTD